jgi:hypothetical protein
MTEGVITTAYIAASVLFILALGGLSNQETARRGNIYGIIGMAIALVATIGGTQVTDYGTLAPSIFTFQNQLDSLLEEELAVGMHPAVAETGIDGGDLAVGY